MRITRLRITNYRGLRALDTEIPATGAVAKGANARGKTSVLRAISAALAARGIGPEDIHLGADRAEILVDLDSLSVKRVITPKASTLTVTSRDGMRATKPQAYLTELLGTSALDPLDLFLEKDKKKRRATILGALPVAVTLEQLRDWTGEPTFAASTEGHGLEVVARVRQLYYDRRTDANKAADEARREAGRADLDAEALEDSVPRLGEVPAAVAARAAHEQAKAEVARLRAQAEESERAGARSAGARERVAKLRAEAHALRGAAQDLHPTASDAERARSELTAARDVVTELERKLADARALLARAEDACRECVRQQLEGEAKLARANAADEQAAALEATIAETAATPPTAEAVDAARIAEASAARACEVAEIADRAKAARDLARQKARAAEDAEAFARRLDGVVRRLTNEAPAELLASANAIPGLAIDGEDVVLDGKRLDALSGAEQMTFAIEVAKRLNAKSKLLVVDGLERLDPEQLVAFVERACAGGWQLIGSRVSSGDVVLEAIEIEPREDAAQ